MFGRKVALKKRELEAAADHFSREERAAMIQKFEEMDAAKSTAVDAAMGGLADPLPICPGEWQGARLAITE